MLIRTSFIYMLKSKELIKIYLLKVYVFSGFENSTLHFISLNHQKHYSYYNELVKSEMVQKLSVSCTTYKELFNFTIIILSSTYVTNESCKY